MDTKNKNLGHQGHDHGAKAETSSQQGQQSTAHAGGKTHTDKSGEHKANDHKANK